jgi:GntR family transcriptional regulator of vanillate catabolism
MSTRTEGVINRLRELLLEGQLAPGTHLHEAAMAQTMGVSRTPVRDALRILANENLLIYSPNKGYVVRQFGIEDIFGAYDVRGVLEGMACRLAAERGLNPATETELQSVLDRSDAIVNSGNWNSDAQFEWLQLNTAFHFDILDYSENQHLMNAARQMRRIPRLYEAKLEPHHTVFQTIYSQQRAKRSHEEHREIFEAIHSRQGMRAESLMREHVFRNREALRRSLPLLQATDSPQGDPSRVLANAAAGSSAPQPKRVKSDDVAL